MCAECVSFWLIMSITILRLNFASRYNNNNNNSNNKNTIREQSWFYAKSSGCIHVVTMILITYRPSLGVVHKWGNGITKRSGIIKWVWIRLNNEKQRKIYQNFANYLLYLGAIQTIHDTRRGWGPLISNTYFFSFLIHCYKVLGWEKFQFWIKKTCCLD